MNETIEKIKNVLEILKKVVRVRVIGKGEAHGSLLYMT